MKKHNRIHSFLSLKIQDVMWRQFISPTLGSIIRYAMDGTWDQIEASGVEDALRAEFGQGE